MVQRSVASELASVWVFNGDKGRFPSAVFSSRARAEEWIATHALTGTLTEYPLDEGVYQWCLEKGYFKPKRPDQQTPEFIQNFSSASQQHEHYEGGKEK